MKSVYKRGNYLAVEQFVRHTKKGIVTRSEIAAFLMGKGLKEAAANATTSVFLSPRKATKREGCDCRGNYSSQGHLYFMAPLAKVEGQERKFRFFMRPVALARHVRPVAAPVKKVVKAVTKKTPKAPKVEAPATPVIETPKVVLAAE